MSQLPPELLALAPLSVAAGIDLYLTLLFLGAAPTTPWWEHPLPGGLDYLDSPVILLVVGTLYLLEFSAERYPTAALVWNAFHAVIRPVAGALLALMLLSGQPLPLQLTGALLGGALASLAHAVRSGGAIVRWLGSVSSPHPLLISLLEDVIVLGLAASAIDAPRLGTVISIVLLLCATLIVPSYLRAFAFAVRLVAGRAFQTLTQRRWRGGDEMPAWVHHSLEGDVFGGGLRGSPAGAHRLPGAPRFTTGWVVVRGTSPLFVYHRRRGVGTVDLGPLVAERVVETDFFRRVDLRAEARGGARVFFGLDGPSEASLRAEFLFG